MNDQEIIERALETLENVHLASINEMPATVQRLLALVKVTDHLPWDEVATLSIGWEVIRDTEGEDTTTILPTLKVVMKEQMS